MMKTVDVEIRPLCFGDVPVIAEAFRAIRWDKPESQYRRYLGEQESGVRAVIVATLDDTFCGYVTVCWDCQDPACQEHRIPEIEDLNVLPHMRRRGIGSALLDAASISWRGATQSSASGSGWTLTMGRRSASIAFGAISQTGEGCFMAIVCFATGSRLPSLTI